MSDTAGQLLEELERLVERLVSSGATAAELTPTQRRLLRHVADSGPIRLNVLAERTGVTCSTASRCVDALHGQGLVERLVDPDDRRALNLLPTPAGTELVRRRREELGRELTRGLAALPATDADVLVAALRRLTDALDPERVPA